jgi:chromosome transmission fidelity protein 18
VAERYDAGESK